MNAVRLTVQGLDEFAERSVELARTLDGGESVSGGAAIIAFESMEGLLALLTPNRWRLLRALRGMRSASIRAVARQLGRDYRGVHADATALISAGLILRDADCLLSVPWSQIEAALNLDSAA